MSLPKLNYNNGIVFAIFLILSIGLCRSGLSQSFKLSTYKALEDVAENYMDHAKYDSAVYYFSQLVEKSSNESEWQKNIQYYLRLIEAYRIMDLFTEADSCLAILELNKNFKLSNYPIEKAEFLHQKGTSQGDQGNYENAINYLDESVQLRIGNSSSADSLLAKSYNNMGTYFYYLGDMKQSLYYYEEAIKIASLRNKNDGEVASYIQNQGIIYARMGDFESALTNFNKTLAVSTEILDPDDPGIANIYVNLGQLSSLLGRYEEALHYNDLAEDIYIKKFGREYGALGAIYINKSRIYIKLADFDEAVRYLNNALNIYKLYQGPDHPDIARIYNNLGSVFITKKDFELALDYFRRSIKIQNDTDARSILMRNIANAYAKIGNVEEADLAYTQALSYTLQELGKEHHEYGNTQKSYGDFLVENKRYQKAEGYIKAAIENFKLHFNERNTNIADLYVLYGQYFYGVKQYEKALETFQKAMIANDQKYENMDVFQNSGTSTVLSKLTLVTVLLEKAKSFSKLYEVNSDEKYLRTSLICYQDAMPIFEKLRSELNYESKFILMDRTSKHFNNAYSDFYKNYKNQNDIEALNKTFEFVEKNKASVLLSSMKNMDAIKFGGIPEESQKVERQLKERISGYENLIYNQKELRNPDSGKIVLWEKMLFELTNRYDSLIEVFGEDYPAYYDLKYDNKVITISEIQNELATDEAIIEYILTDSSLYTFVIDKTSGNFYKTTVDSVFYQNLNELQEVANIDFSSHNLEDYKNYVSASNLVYQTLFSKFANTIKNKKMIIIPDGALGYLSFESLITTLPEMDKINYRNLDYLIKSYPISYSYSSTLLFKNNVAKTSGNEVLAFAPSYDYEPNNIEAESALRQMTNQLKPLLNAQEEVKNVIDIFHGKVYNNEEATETNFKQNSEAYDVLHLAMHTILDDEDPMYSKMVFSMNNDTLNDGYLNTFEIYNLNLKAQLAVLSACNTGSGEIRNGEGIMSLARGFIYSGVPSIVMTLWEVDDKSGADIMTNFYKYLKDGQSKDVALQNAKIEYLSTATQLMAHPYFWSAYVNVGNSKPLRFSGSNNYLGYAAGAILVMVLVFLFLRKQKKTTLKR